MTITLLREIDDLGAPRDWLLARLRGRRTRLLSQPLASDPWSAALAEGRWLYPRCDRSWRRQCAPLLALLEVRRLGSALRFCQGGDYPAAAAALAESLLCAPLLRLLEAELTPDGRLRALAQLPQIRSLLGPAGEIAATRGVRAFEALLIDRLLLAGQESGAGIAAFFKELIDLRNLVTLLKTERWPSAAPSTLLAGGARSERELRRRLREEPALAHLIDELVRNAHRRAREPLTNAVIPDHLVQLALHAVTELEAP